MGLGESWVNYPSWAATERMATLIRGVAPAARRAATSRTRSRVHDVPGRATWRRGTPVGCARAGLAGDQRGRHGAVGPDRPGSVACLSRPCSAGAPAYPGACVRQRGRADAGGGRYCSARRGAGHPDRQGPGRFRPRARRADPRGRARRPSATTSSCARTPTRPGRCQEALEFCHWSAPLRLGWLEEPVHGNRLEDLVRTLRRETGIPLACGENVYGAAEFARYAGVRRRAGDPAGPGQVAAGSRWRPGSRRALPPAPRVAPHCYGGAVVTVASVHLAAAFDDAVPYVELDVRPNPLRDRARSTTPSRRGRAVTSRSRAGRARRRPRPRRRGALPHRTERSVSCVRWSDLGLEVESGRRAAAWVPDGRAASSPAVARTGARPRRPQRSSPRSPGRRRPTSTRLSRAAPRRSRSGRPTRRARGPRRCGSSPTTCASGPSHSAT